MDGNKTGIIGSEFPLFNYLIYLTAKLFGYTHWYGRLINLIVSSIGIFYFYKIVKRFFSESHAFYASLILLVSIWFAFSRKSMPDTFCMSLVFIGIYNGFVYLYEKRFLNLILFFLFSSVAILCKIPALYLLSVLVISFVDREIKIIQKIIISITGFFVLTIMYLWYFYWVPYLLANYGFQLYFPKELMEGFSELISYAPDTLEKFYFSALQSFIAFALFLAGLFFVFKQKQKIMISIFVISTLFFILFIAKTGFVFSVHNYYVIPYVPVMAFVAAFSLEQINNKIIKIGLLSLLIFEAILNQQHDFRIKDSEKYKLKMEKITDKFSSKNDLFLTNGGQGPQQIYFLHRRGWTVDDIQLSSSAYLSEIKQNGCKFIFINKHNENVVDLSKSLSIVYNDENFLVYSLK